MSAQIPMRKPASQRFHHLSGYLKSDMCNALYLYLRDTVKWEEGIKSRKGHTRSGAMFDLDEFVIFLHDFPEAIVEISEVIDTFSSRKVCGGIYLNYYKNGDDWTPNHTHPGTTQIVISLGATRTFSYGKKELNSEHGDIFVFGSSLHGVPKEPSVTEGRISIALFMVDE